jgi:hypothetical protein
MTAPATELYAAAYVIKHFSPSGTFAVCDSLYISNKIVIPIGTATTSVGAYIAECQRVLSSMADEGIHFEVSSFIKILTLVQLQYVLISLIYAVAMERT